MRPEIQKGFSLVAAIFLLVVLALLGALIASVTGMQQASGRLDVLGVRAYHSARAGMEWAVHRALDPNHAITDCSMPSCPTSPMHLPALALGGSLSGFTVSVTCTHTDTTESNRTIRVFQIQATACQPSGGNCLTATPTNGYVERQLQATLAKCKDSTAAAPRCACG